MISYKGDLIACFCEASKDKRFNDVEREVLTLLYEYLQEKNWYDVISENWGTGRIYGIEGYPTRFLVHESADGYNIGVIE